MAEECGVDKKFTSANPKEKFQSFKRRAGFTDW
jgi:hypothetical protein